MSLELENIYHQIASELNATNPFDGLQEFETNKIHQEQLIKTINKHTHKIPAAFKQRIENEFLKYGPIEPLIQNENISEILINNPNAIFFEENGELKKHNDCFFSKKTYLNFIDRFCSENKINIDINKPIAQGKWKHFRFHIVSPPLSPYHLISFRRHQKNYYDLNRLKQVNWSNSIGIECLEHIVDSKSNALIVGPTGTGKTTVLNCLLKLLPDNERVVCIEDTDEIRLPNSSCVKLLTRPENNHSLIPFDQSDLLKESLRLRPDRIVVGEIRGKEAKDLLLALSTGHRGSFSTLHAKSAKEALWRLEILTLMGAPMWSTQTIRGIINTGIDYIIELSSDHKDRKLQSVKKLTSTDGPNYLLEEVWPNKLSF